MSSAKSSKKVLKLPPETLSVPSLNYLFLKKNAGQLHYALAVYEREISTYVP